MQIGIDASRAFLYRRTGIEEYSYRVIRHLRERLQKERVILYVRARLSVWHGRPVFVIPEIDFEIPETWEVRGLWAPRFWTQVRLSLEMFLNPPDVLFVPAHTVPFICPRRTVVTIHGLEYEFSPESYGFWERLYMRLSIRFSARAAGAVVAVSENTKRNLVTRYDIPESKITVVHEGVSQWSHGSGASDRMRTWQTDHPYFFFVGRLEVRKNIIRMIEAFDAFKQKTGMSHQLLLAGKPGYGYEGIQERISNSKHRADIVELGYISESEKWIRLKGADMLLFPSLYEGFGLPVIEAQSIGIPVITSDTSSLPEIAGGGAMLVDPLSSDRLAEAMELLVRDMAKRADIIEKATRNARQFSWERCASELANIMLSHHD